MKEAPPVTDTTCCISNRQWGVPWTGSELKLDLSGIDGFAKILGYGFKKGDVAAVVLGAGHLHHKVAAVFLCNIEGPVNEVKNMIDPHIAVVIFEKGIEK